MAVLSYGDAGRDVGQYDPSTDSPMTLEGEGAVGDALVITSGVDVRPQTPGGGGSVGDVSREGATVDNRIARWHGTGPEVQNSVVTINDDGDISGYGTLTGGDLNTQLTDSDGLLRILAIGQNGAADRQAMLWDDGGGTWVVDDILEPGAGTLNRIPLWTPDANHLGDSDMEDDGLAVTVLTQDFIVALGDVGIGTASPESALDVRGPAGSGAASAGVITASSDELTLVNGDYIGRYNFNAVIPFAGGTPSTGYDTQSVTAGANLTDFTLLVNLANMTAAWWLEANSSDGTKGRVFKDDLTELAVDWISYDSGAETGWIRVKWSGTLSGVVPNTIRIYPPNTANASVAPGDTFGAFNAFDASWKLYLPLNEAANTDGGGYKDRTREGNDGTGVNMSLPEVAGQVGVAQDFDGASDRINASVADSADFTLSSWAKRDAASGIQEYFMLLRDGNNIKNLQWIDAGGNLGGFVTTTTGVGTSQISDTAPAAPSDFFHVALSFNGTTEAILYLDGVQVAIDSGITGSAVSYNAVTIAGRTTGASRNFDGPIDEAQVHSEVRSADWIAEEFAGTKNNLTYWGTWSNVPAGTPGRKVTAFIHAEAADTFTSVVTKTDIVFSTGTTTTATEKMRLGAIGTLGLGIAPLTNMAAGMMVLEGGAIVLAEITTPTADADYAKIYPKADNILYYQDGAGAEHTLPTGTGTPNRIVKWGSASVLDDSDMEDDGSTTTVLTNDFVVALSDLEVSAGMSAFGRAPITGIRVVIQENDDLQTSDMLRIIQQGDGDAAMGFVTVGGTGTDWIMGTRGADGSFGLGLGVADINQFPAFIVDASRNFEIPVGDIDVTLGDLNVLTGTLTVDSDADGTHVIGRAKIGSVGPDVMGVGHFDHFSISSVAIRQSAAGAVSIAAPAGQAIVMGVAGGPGSVSVNGAAVVNLLLDTYWVGEGSGVPFGHIYIDGAQVIIVALTLNTPAEIKDDGTTSLNDGWLAGELNLFTMAVSDLHYYSPDLAGKYEITWDLSFMMATPGANVEMHAGIAVNGTPVRFKGEGHRTIANNTDTGNMGGSLTLDLDADDEISLWVENTTNNADLTAEHANIIASMVGGT